MSTLLKGRPIIEMGILDALVIHLHRIESKKVVQLHRFID